MWLDIVIIIIGIVCVLKGADFLTEGVAALARRVNIPEIVIGLTIVAAGTSAPELFVSLVSALKGTPDLAVGNVVGSNTMNCMLIVGCAAMVAPMTISRADVACPEQLLRPFRRHLVVGRFRVVYGLFPTTGKERTGRCHH